jgi:peptidoglycan/LPS O-acetylase OafA/YrhL
MHLPQLSYRPEIDGLRALAVMLVIGFHSFPEIIPGGYIGVDVFFVISGYLITSIIYTDYKHGKFTVLNFYSKRIIRIFPALLIVLLFCLILGWFTLFPNEYQNLGKNIAAGSGFLSNIILLKEVGYFDINSELKPLLHLWSLGVEEQFYIFWPVFLLFILGSGLNKFACIFFIAAISFAFNIYFASFNSVLDFYSPFSRFWELVFGGYLGIRNLTKVERNNILIWLNNNVKIFGLAVINLIFEFIVALGLILIFCSAFLFKGSDLYPSFLAIAPVLGTIFILSISTKSYCAKFFSNKAVVFIGKISFPLYLWHWPLLCFCRIFKGGDLGSILKIQLICFSALLALITYKYIEIPVQKSQDKSKLSLILLIIMLIVGGLGLFVYLDRGMDKRPYIREIVRLESAFLSPQHFVKSDTSCDALLSKEILYPNVCITNSNTPKIMIAGDSHAIALYGGILNGEMHQSAILFAGNGCLPLDGFIVQDNGVPRSWCENYAQNILNVLDKLPSIKTIYLSTRGPVYFSGEGYGIEGKNKLSIASVRGDGDLSQEDRFYRGYSNFIRQLISKKIEVIMITEVPELGEDPKGCIVKRPILFLSENISTCSQPKQNVLLRKHRYLEIIEKIHKNNPDLKIYHGMNSFCDATTCYGKGLDGLWYWDDDHLSLLGSIKMLKDILRIVGE